MESKMDLILLTLISLAFSGLSAVPTTPNPQMACAGRVAACEKEFQMAITDDPNNATMQCLAGSNLENCLGYAELTKDCKGKTATVDALRNTYKKQIDQANCASAPAPSAPPCLGDLNTCERNFINADNAAGNDAQAECRAGKAFMTCLDVQEHKAECSAYQAVIVQQRQTYSVQLINDGCTDGIPPTVSPCQGDVLQCEKTFETAIDMAGHSVTKQCNAGQVFLQCLTDKDNSAECAAVKGMIAQLRQTYAGQIKADGCVPQARGVDCMPEINKCETNFLDGVTAAGSNVAQACSVGATLENCLKQRENDSNCAPHQTDIDNIRKTYTQQIDQAGCSSPQNVACLQGIENCTNWWNSKGQNLNEGDQCSTATTYVTCLQSLQCPKAYQGQISQIFDLIRQEEKVAAGSCNPFGNAAPVTSMSSLSVIAGLVMAAYFRL